MSVLVNNAGALKDPAALKDSQREILAALRRGRHVLWRAYLRCNGLDGQVTLG